jgi:hypothetical protein
MFCHVPLREHKLEYENGGEINFFFNIRDSYTQQGLSNHIIFRPIKSGATVRLSKGSFRIVCIFLSCAVNQEGPSLGLGPPWQS